MKYYINFDIEHIAELVKCFDRKYERETKLAVKLILNDVSVIWFRQFVRGVVRKLDDTFTGSDSREYLWSLGHGEDDCLVELRMLVYAREFNCESITQVIEKYQRIFAGDAHILQLQAKFYENIIPESPEYPEYPDHDRVFDCGVVCSENEN